MRERERKRERGREGNSRAMIHSIFVVAFILFFIFSLQYTYSGIVTKLTSSAVTRIELLSG